MTPNAALWMHIIVSAWVHSLTCISCSSRSKYWRCCRCSWLKMADGYSWHNLQQLWAEEAPVSC